jgi:hypothetical protein
MGLFMNTAPAIFLIAISVPLLVACGHPGRVETGNQSSLITSGAQLKAEQDAADDLNCRTYSAAPGTELYAQCRAGLAHARAIRQSAPAKTAKTRPLDCTSLALGGGLNCR